MRRIILAALLALTIPVAVPAQGPEREDLPAPAKPKQPFTCQQFDHRQALQLYGLAMKRQHEDRLVEATKLLEEARQLEPQAATIHKELVSLYLALSRLDDALASSKQALDLDPGDHALWALYGRQLKNQSRFKEARNAYTRALGCDSVGDQLDLRVQYHYDVGILNEELKEYDGALKALGEVVRILDEPKALLDQGDFNLKELRTHAENTYERMIKICIQAKRTDRAAELFAEARTKYPSLGSRLTLLMARVEASRGQPNKALAHLEAYLQTQPQGVEAYELLITLYGQLERSADLLPALKYYAEHDAFNVSLQLLLAREYGRARQTKAAEELYLQLATKTTPTPEIYRGLFTLYQGRREMDKVLERLNEALARAPKDEESTGDSQAAAQLRAMLHVLREDPVLAKELVPIAQRRLLGTHKLPADKKEYKLEYQTRLILAVLAARTHQLEAAELLYRNCLNGGDPRKEATAYGGLIQVLFEAKKYDDVVAVCREGLRNSQATNHLLFHQSLARALVFLGKKDEAVAEANLAVDKAPEEHRLDLRLVRMWVLTYAERYADAVAEGQALLKIHGIAGDVQKIRLTLYSAYSAMRDFPKAEEQLQLVLQANPADATANNDLGYLWADQGKNLDEAEQLIRKALTLDEQNRRLGKGSSVQDDLENAAYLDSMGWVLFRKGKLREARHYLEKAAILSQGEEDPVVWDHLGDVCWRMEDRAKALTSWRKSVQLYETDRRRRPDDHYKELKQKLQQLESETPRP